MKKLTTMFLLTLICLSSWTQTLFDGVTLVDGSALGSENGNILIDGTLDAATGDEVLLSVTGVINKATSGNVIGLFLDLTETAVPGTHNAIQIDVDASTVLSIGNSGSIISVGYLTVGTATPTTDRHKLQGDTDFTRTDGIRLLNIASASAKVTFNPDNTNLGDVQFRGDTKNNLIYVDVSADLVGMGTTSPSAQLDIQGTMDTVQLQVDAFSGQTANIVEIEDGAGGALLTVEPDGDFLFGGPSGSATGIKTATTELTNISGTTVTATDLVPAGSVVLGVVVRVTEAITGASAFDVGDGSDADAWGDDIAIALDTVTTGADFTLVTVPVYGAATSIVLTSVTSDFTDGGVRIVVSYIDFTGPTS